MFCSRELKPKDQTAATKEDTVRKLHGRLPTEPHQPHLDPNGNQRRLAHLTCVNSAARKDAGKLDTTGVLRGQEVDAAEREPVIGGVREELGMKPGKPGKASDPMDRFLAFTDAAVHTWHCQRCARWQCNRCVRAALVDGGPPIPDHVGCGGRFAPPT